MEAILWVFGGGALGAMLRYGLGRFIGARTRALLPIGTMTINLVGAFLIGVWVAMEHRMAPSAFFFLDVGFTGAFTTFSTFSYETIRLIEDNMLVEALLNPVLSLVLGLLAAILGHTVGGVL